MVLPIQSDLRALKNPRKAEILSGFFKTGPGQYGEGDVFLGVPVPETRKLVRKYLETADFDTVSLLLKSPYHEERFAGVLMIVEFAKRKTYPIETIARFYMDHRERINSWDLVDVSSEHIIGPYLAHGLSGPERRRFIEDCIASPHLWTNRIIILASFYGIKHGNADMIFSIAPHFFTHPHDLIHKSAGWMLREAGKRVSETALYAFLDTYASRMPRTMLRYAIERMPEEKKRRYMHYQL